MNTGEPVALEVDPPTTKAGSFPGNDQDRWDEADDADIKPILGGPHVDEVTGRVWQPEDTDKATGPFVIGKLARVLADRRLRQAEQRQAEPAASAGALHVSRDFVDPVGKKQSRAVGSGMVFA